MWMKINYLCTHTQLCATSQYMKICIVLRENPKNGQRYPVRGTSEAECAATTLSNLNARQTSLRIEIRPNNAMFGAVNSPLLSECLIGSNQCAF